MSYEWGGGLGAKGLTSGGFQQNITGTPQPGISLVPTIAVGRQMAFAATGKQPAAPSVPATDTVTGKQSSLPTPEPAPEDIVPIPEADRLAFRTWYAAMRKARPVMLTETTRMALEAFYTARNRMKWLAAEGISYVPEVCVGVAIWMWWERADKDGLAAWDDNVISGAGRLDTNVACTGANQGRLIKAPKRLYNHFRGWYNLQVAGGRTPKVAVERLVADPGLNAAQQRSMLGFDIVEQKKSQGVNVAAPQPGLERVGDAVKGFFASFMGPQKGAPSSGIDINVAPNVRKQIRTDTTPTEDLISDVTDSVEHDAQVAALETQIQNLRRQLTQASQQDQADVVAALRERIAELNAQLAVQEQYAPPADLEPAPGFLAQYKWPLIIGGVAAASVGAWFWYRRRKATRSPMLEPTRELAKNPRPVSFTSPGVRAAIDPHELVHVEGTVGPLFHKEEWEPVWHPRLKQYVVAPFGGVPKTKGPQTKSEMRRMGYKYDIHTGERL